MFFYLFSKHYRNCLKNALKCYSSNFPFSGASKLSADRHDDSPCNKDTGTLSQLRGHSRGILPMISGARIFKFGLGLETSFKPVFLDQMVNLLVRV